MRRELQKKIKKDMGNSLKFVNEDKAAASFEGAGEVEGDKSQSLAVSEKLETEAMNAIDLMQ